MEGDRQRRDLAGEFGGAVPGVRPPSTRDGLGDLGDQTGLPVRSGAEAPQVSDVHAMGRQVMGRAGDEHGIGVIEAAGTRGDESGLDQRVDEFGFHSRLLHDVLASEPGERVAAEVIRCGTGDPVATRPRPERGGRPVGDGRVEGLELLPDDLERQVAVALRGEDIAEALAVRDTEPAVAARSPVRGDQPLVLEEPDLRHRQVRELRTQKCDDATDGEVLLLPGALSGCCHCPGVPVRKTRRNLPIWTSSPFESAAESTGSRLTYVPLSEPTSTTVKVSFSLRNSACRRLTVTSSRKMSLAG